MSETEFTSGTWHASATFRAVGTAPGIDIGSSNGANIALVHYERQDDAPRETRANARLIAAAPDLYAALNRIVDSVARTSSGDVCQEHDFDYARNALAKARGEQP